MSTKIFYLTTPLTDLGDPFNFHHLESLLVADSVSRYFRLTGRRVCLMAGGRPPASPESSSSEQAPAPLSFWKSWGIQVDEFVKGGEAGHQAALLALFERIGENGFLYQNSLEGSYCPRCELYLNQAQAFCPDCGSATHQQSGVHHFFKLSAFSDKLLDFYRDRGDLLVPGVLMAEVLNFVKEGLHDLNVSRPAMGWGVALPEQPEYEYAAWFEGLSAYLAGAGYGFSDSRFATLWPAAIQVLGRPLLRLHAVYWPALLMAAGLEPPRRLLCHGLWRLSGRQAARWISRGEDLPAPDYFRYYLLREGTPAAELQWGFRDLLRVVREELLEQVGELAGSCLSAIQEQASGLVPESGHLEPRDEELRRFTRETVQLYREHFERLQLSRALENVRELISLANKYFQSQNPARLEAERLRTVLYHTAECLRILALLLSPVTPGLSEGLLGALGVPESKQGRGLTWGGVQPGTPVDPQRVRFPTVSPPAQMVKFLRRISLEAAQATPPPAEPGEAGTPERQLRRLGLKVGRVLEAKKGQGETLHLKVDLGEEVRQLALEVSGLKAGELPGQLVLVATGMGLSSQGEGGVILTGVRGEQRFLITLKDSLEPGTGVA